MKRDVAQKALTYATSGRGLLVFDEPDFPDVPTQVPGGSIDTGETALAAAQREFKEETGLDAVAMEYLGAQSLTISGYGFVHRQYFHTGIADDLPESRDHWEQHASGEKEPILFRFRWVPLSEASAVLGEGMGALVYLIQR